jgi:hypothetical protein
MITPVELIALGTVNVESVASNTTKVGCDGTDGLSLEFKTAALVAAVSHCVSVNSTPMLMNVFRRISLFII